MFKDNKFLLTFYKFLTTLTAVYKKECFMAKIH